MKKIVISILCLLTVVTSFATAPKKNFTSGDVFGIRVFIENNGQFDASTNSTEKVLYAIENGDEKIYFTKKGLIHKLTERFPITQRQEEKLEHGKNPKLKSDEHHYISMNWVNANSDIQVEQFDKTNHYFTYGGPELTSYGYKRLLFRNVYNKIDFEYFIPENKDHGIKYNVILHPGANPSDIQMAYTGDFKKITIDAAGNVNISTKLDPIIEHAPLSFYESKEKIESKFSLNQSTLSFDFPKGYNSSKKVIIDPWITNLTSLVNNNLGYDVDYDYAGNLFVYGGTVPFRTAMYNPAGILQWTFQGTVAAPVWNGAPTTYASNFCVNKFNSKAYIGQGYAPGVGAKIIRLTAAGVYDNFVTTANTTWQEVWDMGFYCTTGDVYALGGCPGQKMSGSLINQTTGAIAPTSFMPASTINSSHDITCGTIDDAGTVFIYYTSSQATIKDQMARINAAFTNTVWLAHSTYSVMTYCQTKSVYPGMAGIWSNGFNCLAVNANYLFFYDGFDLAAYNKNTGAKIAFTTVPGLTLKQQGGIAVDDCNNLYLGGNNSIVCYNFNGTNFTPLANIPVNSTTANKNVFDVKLDKPNSVLYISGAGFVGSYSAIHSTNCIANTYSIVPFCSGNIGGAVASVTTTLGSPVYDYIWTNATGTVSSTFGSAANTNTVNPLANGIYSVTIRINNPCGPIWTGTVDVNCPTCSVTASGTTGCVPIPAGTTTSLSVNSISGYTPAPNYSWTGPGGYTSNQQNPNFFNAGNYGTYTLVVSNATCSYSTTVVTNPVSIFTPVLTQTAVLCNGGSTGLATATVNAGGTAPFIYNWSNGQNTQTATNLSAGNYSCNVIDNNGCLFSSSVLVTEPTPLNLAINSNTNNVCAGLTINANGIAAGGTSPYSYTWTNGPNSASNNFSEAIPGNYVYTLTVADINGCVAVNSIPLTFNPIPIITVSDATVCYGQTAVLTASGSTSYLWIPSNNTMATYTLTGTNSQQFSVVGIDAITGCSSLPVLSNLTVNQLPTPQISSSKNSGCAPHCMTFTAINTSGSIQNVDWLFGDGTGATGLVNTDRCYNVAGTYTAMATVTDNNGCANSTTYTLIAHPIPVADFNYAPLKPIINNAEVTFTDASYHGNIVKWDWYFKNTPLPYSNLQNPVYVYTEPGQYQIALVATTEFGCIDTIIKTIVIGEDYGIYVPNAFSPNGDGLNDVFQPKGFGITKYELEIFDRWGELVFRTSDFSQAWDGTVKGKVSKNEIFVWKINLTNVHGKSNELTGHVTLIK